MAGVPEEVADGVWRIVIDLPEATLTVNVFVLKDTDGNLLLIDVGWRNLASVGIIEDALRALGHSLEDIRQVAITHGHPDHAGLASTIQELTGCRVFLEGRDEHLLTMYRSGGRSEEWRAFMESHGMPVDDLASQIHAQFSSPWMRFNAEQQAPPKTERLELLEGVGLRSIKTPGHSPGHACFHLPQSGVLFSGDHVLPHITPNVQLHPNSSDANPLGEYVESLALVADLPVSLVLPAHGEPFTDLRGRVDEIADHHKARTLEVLAALDSGPRTAWEVASRVSWKQGGFDSLPYFHKRMAVGETLAHLRALKSESLVRERDEQHGMVRFSLS